MINIAVCLAEGCWEYLISYERQINADMDTHSLSHPPPSAQCFALMILVATDLIFVTNITNNIILVEKNCYMDNFQLSILNI